MTSLTAPWDRQKVHITQASKSSQMNDDEFKYAKEELYDTSFIEKFPKVDRLYADPIYNNQMYSLHSFIPSKGAQPDEHGVYGFMKFRGSFQTIEEANDRAEFIIRNVDSYHPIQTGYIGRPFPVCVDTKKFVKETKQIDIRNKAIETVSEDIKQKRLNEKKEIEDIKEREKKLLETTGEDYAPEPLEKYTTLHVKKANLVYTYLKTQEKILELREHIKKAYAEIRYMDEESSEYKLQYFEKYKDARKQAGLPEKETSDSFMKYICEDADLDFEY